MKHIFCIFILFYANLVLGGASSDNLSPDPMDSFIDKGNVTLPVAPEVAQNANEKIDLPLIVDSVVTQSDDLEPDIVMPPVTHTPKPVELPKEEISESKNADILLPALPPGLGEESKILDENTISQSTTSKVKSSFMPKVITDFFSKNSTDEKDEQPDLIDETQNVEDIAHLVPVLPEESRILDKQPIQTPDLSSTTSSVPSIKEPIIPAPAPIEQTPAVVSTPAQAQPVPTPAPIEHATNISESVVNNRLDRKNQGGIVPKQEENNALKSHLIQSPVLPTQSILPVATPKEPDYDLEKFVHNETQMLVVPDDDILLGALTDEARLNDMGYSEYLSLYLQYRESVKKLEQSREVSEFIDMRRGINGNDIPLFSNKYLFANAVSSIQSNKLDDLRALADNYNILDLIDNSGNTLMHIAAYKNNMNLTKWLIMRGANVSAINYDSISPRDIAQYEQYWSVFNLLESANAQ